MPSLSHRDLTHLGMDVHKDSISVGILRPEEESPDERIFNDEPSVRRLLARFEDPRRLSVCTRPGPRATSCTACSRAWASAAR